MTQVPRESPWYRLATLVILLVSSNAIAVEIIDARDLHQQKSSDQPVTGFYAVTPDGKTKPIDPVKSGLATSGTADLSTVDSEPPNRSASTEELPELEPARKRPARTNHAKCVSGSNENHPSATSQTSFNVNDTASITPTMGAASCHPMATCPSCHTCCLHPACHP